MALYVNTDKDIGVCFQNSIKLLKAIIKPETIEKVIANKSHPKEQKDKGVGCPGKTQQSYGLYDPVSNLQLIFTQQAYQTWKAKYSEHLEVSQEARELTLPPENEILHTLVSHDSSTT